MCHRAVGDERSDAVSGDHGDSSENEEVLDQSNEVVDVTHGRHQRAMAAHV
jgi:hypothetical protein